MEALHHGADVFTEFNNDVELNVQLALAQLLRCNERDQPPKKPAVMTIYEKFMVSPDTNRIFYNDERLKLTKIECNILRYLIENHDIPLSYDKIYSNVWGRDCDKAGHKSLWDYVLKIRKKLKEAGCEKEYIITERDTGYRFTARPDK